MAPKNSLQPIGVCVCVCVFDLKVGGAGLSTVRFNTFFVTIFIVKLSGS